MISSTFLNALFLATTCQEELEAELDALDEEAARVAETEEQKDHEEGQSEKAESDDEEIESVQRCHGFVAPPFECVHVC